MSSRQDINKPHKCVAAKCKGRLSEPRENYGYWAYWHPGGRGKPAGWFSKSVPKA